MKKLIHLLLASLLLAGLLLATTAATAAAPYANNRAPLREKPFVKLPLGAIRAEGWLRDQLQRQADGLTGHLDSVYPEVMGPRNGWLGGDGDVWERGPYWIDGLLPLAYILGDRQLIEKTRPWVEWALGSRQPDGYFGPAEDRPFESPAIQRDNARDWWPKMVMLKVLQQYYSATGDERVIELMSAYFRYQLRELPKTPLGHWTFWGEQRGGDNLGIVYWLYNITGDEFLLELGDLIHRQTFDWTGILAGGEVIPTPFSLHCVNLAQGIKEPVVYYQRSNDPAHVAAVKKGFADIRRYIGLPTGLYGGDEALHGAAPTQGSELCTVVEMMYSLEEMAEITGDVQFADHLERVAFNALPTQATDAYDARQYYQQVNQVMITDHRRNFEQSHDGTDILYGLLTGYACCTSNMHQGWPKFTQNLWYATHDGGLAAMVYSPCNVTAEVAGGVRVTIAERTQYPFDEQIRFEIKIDGRKVKTAEFPLRLRIPGWCEGATVAVNGQAVASPGKGSVAEVRRAWRTGDVVTLRLPMEVAVSRWYELGRRRARAAGLLAAHRRAVVEGQKPRQTDLRPVVLRGAAYDPVELHALRGGRPPRTHCGGIQGRAARHRRRLSVDAGKRPGGDQGARAQTRRMGALPGERRPPAVQHQRERQSRRRDHADPLRLHDAAHHRVPPDARPAQELVVRPKGRAGKR